VVSPEAIDRDPSPEFTLSEVEGAQDDNRIVMANKNNSPHTFLTKGVGCLNVLCVIASAACCSAERTR
jgi:hypothetical protein